MVEFIEGQHYRQILQYIEDEFLVSKTNKKGKRSIKDVIL
ncbi:MAG: hypothetical protein KatS3mg129_1055 [Leptospiraceae bacterium]|nr:MAG: hypothetical protein KatS3mg129_1055 [Leptospiraceae bacterium]